MESEIYNKPCKKAKTASLNNLTVQAPAPTQANPLEQLPELPEQCGLTPNLEFGDDDEELEI